MSTKLNERLLKLATKVRDERTYGSRYAIADAIESIAREVAQPIADERDELREALEAITAKASIGIPYYAYGDNEAACRMADDLGEIEKIAEAILAKYPKP